MTIEEVDFPRGVVLGDLAGEEPGPWLRAKEGGSPLNLILCLCPQPRIH